MRNRALHQITYFFAALLLTLVVFTSACQQAPPTNSNTTANTTSVNTNTSATNSNTSTPPIAGTTIEAREPDMYSATITLKVEAQGEGQTNTIPALAADFVKNGSDRKVSFKLGNEQVIFQDSGSKRYIISPNRRQYAELTPESTGFNVPTVMTPGQIISSVKGMTGCEQQGEAPMGGRTATKYRCAGKSSTGTQAGDVTTEAFIYVDKETGLPLRSESVLSASGSVQGVKGLKLVTEMSNINTSVDANQFAEPQGMSKVSPEQVKQQVDLVVRAALAIAGQIMSNNSGTPATGSATPANAASPTPSAMH
jgi:hypothetical protein